MSYSPQRVPGRGSSSSPSSSSSSQTVPVEEAVPKQQLHQVQAEVLQQLPDAMPEPGRPRFNVVVTAPTSWGKSLLAIRAADRIIASARGSDTQQKLVVVVVPTVILVQQTASKFVEQTELPIVVAQFFGCMTAPMKHAQVGDAKQYQKILRFASACPIQLDAID